MLKTAEIDNKKGSSSVLVASQGPGKAQGRNKRKHKAKKAKGKGPEKRLRANLQQRG
jgi:hypothetical protein